MKELKEMTSEELLEQIKAESNAEDMKAKNREQFKKDLAKFSGMIRDIKKAKVSLAELERKYKDLEPLQSYIAQLKLIEKLNVDIDNARKGYLYESAVLSPDTPMETIHVKLSLTMPHDREDFNKDKFVEDYGIEKYREYITTKSVKGNIKFKIKE